MESNFHISLPCQHVAATRRFYTEIIGGEVGRFAENWIDINLFGHQITFTKSGKFKFDYPNYVFGRTVLPSFHFGVILSNSKWNGLYKKLKREDFLFIDATHFLTNKVGAHRSFFLRDPNGYIIEFKCFEEEDSIFEA